MLHKCPRTLDKPILLFGLEVEDIGLLSLIVGVGSLVIGPVIPGVLAAMGWVGLIMFKRDKPPGFLLHWIYSKGFGLPGLIAPVKKVKRYSLCHL